MWLNKVVGFNMKLNDCGNVVVHLNLKNMNHIKFVMENPSMVLVN